MKYVIGDIVDYRIDDSIFAGKDIKRGVVCAICPSVMGNRYQLRIKASDGEYSLVWIREVNIISKIESPTKYADPA